LSPNLHVPLQLRGLKNWLVWRLIQKEDAPKPSKIPFYANGKPRPNIQGSDEDRSALTTVDHALAACQRGGYAGLGLGVLPDCGFVVLDFDHCVKDGVIDPRVVELVSGTYCEFSPSGTGVHAFFIGTLKSRKDNADKKDRRPDGTRKDGKFDIEFFGSSGFVTFTGKVTPDCELLGFEDTISPLTPAVLALYEQRFGTGSSLVPAGGYAGSGGDDDLLSLHETLGWSTEFATGMLGDCDPGVSRDTWLKVLMALHHEFDGSADALELAVEWSSGAMWAGGQPDNYGGRNGVESVWRSFGRSGGSAITGKWLLVWHKEQLGKRGYEARDEWAKTLREASDEFTIREKHCPAIAKDVRLDDMAREAIAQMLFEAFKRTGTKFPIAQCRKLVAPKATEKPREKSRLPEWLEGWVYVTDDDKFYRMDSDEWLTMSGFNAKFNRELPVDEEGSLAVSAAWVALTHHGIPTVTRGVYLPWADRLFEMDGIQCVNTYRPSSVPVAVDALTVAGRGAVGTVLRHLRLLCGNREDVVQTFIDWLAHNVQKPGVKIRWAPLVKGIEGDGKTVIGSLLAAVMGRVNVHNVSPKVLGTDFTGWAEGSSVVVLEEIKLTGHNRYDILNALKPFITNDSTEVHRKGQDGYDSINTTNYIAFTNYADALPLTDTDRRWWILFTPFIDAAAMARAIGQGDTRSVLGSYFDQLHNAIHQHRAELRRWLLDHHIGESFKPNGSAPLTEEKQLMISMSMSDEEQSVREILTTGAVGVTSEVFLSTYLRNALSEMGVGSDINTSAWSRLLSKIGYTRQPKKFKWKGRAENVWVRGHRNLEPEQIRQVLLGTLPEGETDDEESLF
jgi:hypothetical protein